MDSNLDFRKMLRDVSIQTFIKYYNIFEENYNISDNSVIHENFKKNNETWSHNSCNSRATKGKRIFKNNLQLKALMYIAYEAEENRLSSEIITQAKNLLEINHDLLQEVNRIKNKDSKSSFPEGAIVERIHLQRERNSNVIKIVKQNFQNKFGKLFCQVCEFDFQEKYGTLGEGFIEGHHTIPVSKMELNHKTKPEDIAIVCSNCHRMLHRKRPWLSINELKDILKDD